MNAVKKNIPPGLAAALDYLRRGWASITLCPANHAGVQEAHVNKCHQPGKAPLWKKDY